MTHREGFGSALAIGGIALCLLAGCGGSSTPPRVAAAPPSQATAAAQRFLARYVAPDGRVQRLDEGDDTVGEGQAYGMLLAAAIGDSARFDKIWGWTKDNLQRSDGLISFLWRNGRVVDPQAATDADLDASRALLVAACRFHRPSLKREGLQLGRDIMRVEVGTVKGAPVLTAGPWAVSPPVTVNPSYFSPASYAALRAASGDRRWSGLEASSLAITNTLMPAPGRLPPDWAWFVGNKVVPIGLPDHPTGRPQFGFDAVRTLVRMAEDPNPAGRQIAARAWPVFADQNPAKLPVEHDLSGRPTGDTLHPVALVAAAGAASAAGEVAARDGLLDAADALDRRTPTYYGAAWVALGRIMLTTHLLDACS
jgi:endo-1,4-beta-D-glucanase Y